MCGLMFLAGDVPDDVVTWASHGAAKRGPHSSGVARWTGDGWDVHRYPGRLPVLRSAAPGIVVAHSRLATTGARPGDRPDPAEGQPLSQGRWVVAHNGNIERSEWEAAGIVYDGPVDSGALVAALHQGVPVYAVLGHTAAPQAALWCDGAAVYADRWAGDDHPAHPLYAAAGPGWCAISSGPMPRAELLSEGTHQVWRLTT